MDPNCLYSLSTGRDCFLASHLERGTLGFDFALIRSDTVSKKEFLTAFWIYSVEKRGHFCDLCDCHEDSRSIDCRGKELLMVPKTLNAMSLFGFARESQFVLFGFRVSFRNLVWSSRARLPESMIHLGANSLANLPDLSALQVLRPSSSFMSEDAESVEKCAEYCQFSQDCRYVSYDGKQILFSSLRLETFGHHQLCDLTYS